MKLKRFPEDFVVEEVINVEPCGQGEFSLFRLVKKGANTLDVIRDLSKRLKVSFNDISYCGLKDRYSLSIQFIAVRGNIKRDVKARNYEVCYIGKIDEPLGRDKLLGNLFKVVVRDLERGVDEYVGSNVEDVIKFGFVNYYDDQRFGSARHGKGFFAKELINRNYEKALKLLIATPSRYDEKKVKRFKRCVRDNWGRWEECINLAVYPYEKRILSYLRGRKPTPSNIKKALELIDHEYLLLLLHAYQSYIWNEVVKGVLREMNLELFPVRYAVGELLFYKKLNDGVFKELRDMLIPFPGPKLKPEGLWGKVLLDVLKREGIGDIKNFKTRIKGGLFETHRRKVVVFPKDLTWSVEDDDVYKGKKKLHISVFLPSGTYVTILLKRILLLS